MIPHGRVVVVVVVGRGRVVVVVGAGGFVVVVVVVVVVTAWLVEVVVVVVLAEEEDDVDDDDVEDDDDTVCDGVPVSVGISEGTSTRETWTAGPPDEGPEPPAAKDPKSGPITVNAATTAPMSAPVASLPGPLIAANTRIAYRVHSIGSSKPGVFYAVGLLWPSR
ncbi:hypothetical protein BBK82_14200 [Lentzea guizhouensis]|uniref:Uncharacterized protein n=1 Tax=Lentzea guizhouensis TaxID=1586287 RepID=A0A1B2HH79_9PSEU|nr:hypothetical protein [Lentzea guizhouensis]ANZ37049.1 hypothetical protein BBK82_14200 [Lentzea guizhouensis]